jgi:hypothetical protein
MPSGPLIRQQIRHEKIRSSAWCINQLGEELMSRIDAKAALARVKEIISTLRNCSVCKSWQTKVGDGFMSKLDEAAAKRMLAYFRQQAKNGGAFRNSPGWQAALDFLKEHGQSLDWGMLGDPGGLICQGAAASPRAKRAES